MEKFYEEEKLYLFNQFLQGKKKDLAIIRKYKYSSKFRGRRRLIQHKRKKLSSPFLKNQDDSQDLILQDNITLQITTQQDPQQIQNERRRQFSQKTFLNWTQITAIIILTFAVEYGFAIEMVFISPLFLKLDTPALLDSSMQEYNSWLFPPVMNQLIYPFVRHYSECKGQSPAYRSHQLKKAMIVFICLSLFGIGLLADTKSICTYIFNADDNKKSIVLIVSITSFTLMDVGLEMLGCICQIYLEDFIHPKQSEAIQHYSVIAVSFGKFMGFLISSVLAFNFIYLNFDNFIENLSFAYLVGFVFLLFGFVLMLASFPAKNQKHLKINGLNSSKIQLSLNSFLPGITLVRQLPNSMKLLMLSHLLTCGSQLFVSVYATLWSGITMLEYGSQEYNSAIRSIVFDIGISWGALALCLSALLHLLTTLTIQQIKSAAKLNYIYIIINTFAGLTLLYTWLVNEFYSIFITLPFWGISIAVLQEIPQRLATQLENQQVRHEDMKDIFPQMLAMTTFLAQLVLFLLIPLCFIMFSQVDDISGSLFVSSVFSLVGSFLAIFLDF